MKFLEIIAAFFYLQPSLIVSFVPMQIISLFVSLVTFKKLHFLRAFFYSCGATFCTTISVFLAGIFIVPFIYVRFFRLVEISLHMSLFLFLLSVFIYWIGISCYLRYILNLDNSIKITSLSSVTAGLGVLVLYYLWWHQ